MIIRPFFAAFALRNALRDDKSSGDGLWSAPEKEGDNKSLLPHEWLLGLAVSAVRCNCATY
jgi:hypothetical protein